MSEEIFDESASSLLAYGEEERRRVARELHDDIGQRLAMLADKADQLRRDWNVAPCPLRRQLDYLVEQARLLSEDLRHVSRNLHPAIIQELGFVAAIRSLCDDFQKQYGIVADLQLRQTSALQLTDRVSTALYRILQEALRNVAKHARVNSVAIVLTGGPEQLTLSIADSGIGFEVVAPGGLGLTSMRERAHLLGGVFSVASSIGRGTTVSVSVPLH